jgi:hypothetical protein
MIEWAYELERRGRGIITVLPQHLRPGTEENYEKVRIRVATAIRTDDIENKSLERYRQTTLLGKFEDFVDFNEEDSFRSSSNMRQMTRHLP